MARSGPRVAGTLAPPTTREWPSLHPWGAPLLLLIKAETVGRLSLSRVGGWEAVLAASEAQAVLKARGR